MLNLQQIMTPSSMDTRKFPHLEQSSELQIDLPQVFLSDGGHGTAKQDQFLILQPPIYSSNRDKIRHIAGHSPEKPRDVIWIVLPCVLSMRRLRDQKANSLSSKYTGTAERNWR